MNKSKSNPRKNNDGEKKKNNWWRARLFQGGAQSKIVAPTQPQINIGQTISPLCPYKAWNHYFPIEEYTAVSPTVQRINIFEKYMEDVFKKQDIHAVVNCGSISIDSKDLISHPFVREKIPNLFEEISQKPEKIISCLGRHDIAAHTFKPHRQHGRVDWNPVYGDNDHEVEPHDGYVIVFLGNALYSNFLPLEEMHCVSSTGHSEAGLAAHHHVIKRHQSLASLAENEVRSQLIRTLADIPVIRARLYNFEPLTALKNLKARTYGKFVAIKGTLVKVSNVKPLCTTMAFRCMSCQQLQAILLINNNYMAPSACVRTECKRRNFEALRNHPLTEITDWQLVKLQESASDEQREAGRMPRTIEVELTRDLTDSASPGDVVTITGIVKVKKSEDGRWKVKDKSMFLLYIEGNHVSNSRCSTMKDCRSNAAEHLLDFNSQDLAGIQEIQKQDEVFSLLVCSLCPTIYGQDMVKAGLLLSLFGGSQKEDDDKDRIPVRGNSHVLLVGDPGLGKSQLLQAVSRLAPRGVYVCGNASSNSGLTVTLSRDATSGDTSLEAGALVLADQGVCCIDEFDKMSAQHQALLEAMEQQCISIAKAGIVCSMPARCSIVAAANPSGGHYNKAKTVSENLRMGGALLSRFDLVYILLDTPNEQRDRLLSDHVMAVHTGKGKVKSRKDLTVACNAQASADTGSLNSKLISYASKDDCDPVPHYLMWKYIAYVRKNVKEVKLNEEACQVLKKFYLELRQRGHQLDSTPITTRQLESLQRLTQARAKVELRTVATAADASDVVEILRHSLYDTYTNQYDELAFDRSLHGSGVSVRSKFKKLLAALIKASDHRSNNLFSTSDIRQVALQVGINSDVSNLIDSLNNKGYLLKTGSSMYKLQPIQ